MKIIISPRAEKQLRKASKVNQIIIAKRVRSLHKRKDQKLKGYKNIFRTSIGDYRIVYKKTRKEIHIVLIGHRKEVYKILKMLI